ncbi:MAG TPA: hypothetical protein VKU41_02245 [Polyangiaceae bacterium]|nr:hypothetical protein [Polyangiaceae bacterium]
MIKRYATGLLRAAHDRVGRVCLPSTALLLLLVACGSQATPSRNAGSGQPSSGATPGAGSGSGAPTPGSGVASSGAQGDGGMPATSGSSSGSTTSATSGTSAMGSPEGGSEASAGADAGGGALPPTGTLPPVKDPGVAGSFTPTTTNNTGPSGNYTAIYPKELGQGGVKNPIVIWGDGAALNPTSYMTLLDHLASHGFAILAYNATPQGSDMTAAIDWIVSESTRQGSVFYDTVDTTKIAAMGHSAGSLATFAIANDARLTTTMHLNGGTMSPHTDEMNLVKPAAFICGDSGGDGLIVGDVARPNCDVDYQNATTAVWYGDVIGSAHLTITGTSATDPKLKAYLTATAGWLRWQLAADTTMKALFVPASTCTLCTQSSQWAVQEKNLP